MVPEHSSSMAKEARVVKEKSESVRGSLPEKKNHEKVPKKAHKAEREKLKRDQLNELFLELGHALNPSRQNGGKASILNDATKLLRGLIKHVESLRKENAALLSETHYLTLETNELRDEKSALEAEIEKLSTKPQRRIQRAPSWDHRLDASSLSMPASSTLPIHHSSPPVIGQLYMIPVNHDLQRGSRESSSDTSPPPPNLTHGVSRPQARYPTQLDSWPLDLLNRYQSSLSRPTNTSNGREESSSKTL